MIAVNNSGLDFYIQQRLADNKWRTGVCIAVALHLGCLFWSLYGPAFFLKKEPLLHDAVTVDLVSMPSLAPEPVQSPPAAAPQKTEPAPQPAVIEKQPLVEDTSEPEISVAREPEIVPEQPVAAKPISLKPRSRKVKIAPDPNIVKAKERQRLAAQIKKEAEQRQRKQDLAREKRRRAAAAAKAEKARLEAEKAAAEARQALAEMYRQQGALQQKTVTSIQTATNNNRGSNQSVVAQQYYASLYQHLHGFWILPETRSWNRNLRTTVVLEITRDGNVIYADIEQKSTDPVFDQLVLKTIRNASPMPTFPKLMKDVFIEVGIHFSPGKLEL